MKAKDIKYFIWGDKTGEKNKKKTIGNKHGGKKRQIKKERKKHIQKKYVGVLLFRGWVYSSPGLEIFI